MLLQLSLQECAGCGEEGKEASIQTARMQRPMLSPAERGKEMRGRVDIGKKGFMNEDLIHG